MNYYFNRTKNRLITIFISIFALFSAVVTASETIPISTKNTMMVFGVKESQELTFLYFGQKLANSKELASSPYPWTERPAMPTFGGHRYVNEPMITATHANGELSTELYYVDHKTTKVDDNVSVTEINLKDNIYPFFVTYTITSYFNEDMLSQKVTVRHEEDGEVRLGNSYSSLIPLHSSDLYLSHFYGTWGDEFQLEEEKLGHGIKTIESKKGVRTTQSENASYLVSLDGKAKEDVGEVIGGALAWSGNYKLSFEMDEVNNLSILAGMNPFVSVYSLVKGEVFETPDMLTTYSASGKGLVSRNFHRWARKYGLMHGDQERPIVLNSWEGVYFNFDENTITNMIDDAAELGVEMFVLDDGWFGNEYPRNSSKAGLGDWQVNKKKLPQGINYLAAYANKKDLRFGLWIEPEMVNPKSELAINHPDWIVKRQGREALTARSQLMLDVTNPEVQDFIFKVVEDLLDDVPNIEYIKWDANRHVENIGSNYLSKEKQSHFWIDYTKGLYAIYDRVRQKYPNLILQACASGGGRIDFGSLKYHDEFWSSDNTDPLTRVYLQYGTNHFYPAIATGSHISASPNHQTKRVTSLKFRTDVAMSGRLGMELQLKDIKGKDREYILKAMNTYKEIRHVIQFGDLYRMHSPYDDSGWSSLNYVESNLHEAIAFLFTTKHHDDTIKAILKFKGLDPKKTYKIEELNIFDKKSFHGQSVYSGDYLMKAGIMLNATYMYDSVVLRAVVVD